MTDLSEKDAVEELLCLSMIFCDVCIGVHAKDVWVRIEWKTFYIFKIAVVLYKIKEHCIAVKCKA